jgi:hypothetical protein
MDVHKNELSELTAQQLITRRRRLATRLGDPEQMLAGSLVEQHRRCGKAGCRCATGPAHGPYAYFSPRDTRSGRLRYVPAALVEVVRRYLRRTEDIETVLADISAVNTELLRRRELA